MKAGVGGDEAMILGEVSTSPVEDGVEIVDAGEVAVGDRLVDQRPEVLGRLQFGRIGWQVNEPDAVRHREIGFGVPAGAVEDEHDAALAPGANRVGEARKQPFEEGLVDAVREIPDGLAADRLHEGRDIEPLIAVVTERDRPLADRRPDAALDRFQTEPMFIRRPDFDR